MKRSTLVFLVVFLTIGVSALGQGIFGDCVKGIYRHSKPEGWQRDTLQCTTFVRNCCSSTTFLVLYNDSTFQYKVDRCGIGSFSEGKWKMVSRRQIMLFDSKAIQGRVKTYSNSSSVNCVGTSVDGVAFLVRGEDLVEIR